MSDAEEMDAGKIPIKIQVFGIGVLEGFITRYVSPLSADAILDKLPIVLRGRFNFGSKDYWILPDIGIRKGANMKATKNVTSGDIVYNPKTDEISILLKDIEMPNKINKLGTVSKNLNLLEKARNGLNCKISKT